MDLKEIKKLAEQERYDEALSITKELLADKQNLQVDILRVRAYVYSLMGDYRKALQERNRILATNDKTIRDYYLAGDNAISVCDFKEASVLLKKVLMLGEEQKESWFDSAAYFLLAYAQMELCHYEEALIYVKNAATCDPDCAIPLPGLGNFSHDQLREQILKRVGSTSRK